MNDAAFFLRAGKSVRLGSVFSLRLPGLLHMEIVRSGWSANSAESDTTAPSVRYRITRVTGEVVEVDSPAKFRIPATSRKSKSRSSKP